MNEIKISAILLAYTQFLFDRGYLDDDWIFEMPSPVIEFINHKGYKWFEDMVGEK